MISQKSYLIKAIYEWCQDNQWTPYLAANVDQNTILPNELKQNKQIVLNISFSATKDLEVKRDYISFKTNFSGTTHEVIIPTANVLAIFAKENGQGMQFEQEEHVNTNKEVKKTTSSLKIVK